MKSISLEDRRAVEHQQDRGYQAARIQPKIMHLLQTPNISKLVIKTQQRLGHQLNNQLLVILNLVLGMTQYLTLRCN